MTRIAVCRFCGDTCAPHEPTRDVAEFAVRYSTRASAHVSCAIKRKGVDWVLGLHTWQIDMLPQKLVSALGIREKLVDELERRRHLNSTGQLRHNLRSAQ